jgi:ribosomal protein S18 acetylase RimI-like enzyme
MLHVKEPCPHYSLRKGNADDKQWLYELYCQTLRPAIEQTWGWEEGFQMKQFNEHLKPDNFEILTIGGNPIGGFYVVENADHFWLEMLLINPSYQSKGIGNKVIKQIQRMSAAKKKPLKLCVIKSNPVQPFYEKLGFRVYEEDKAFYKMIWEG